MTTSPTASDPARRRARLRLGMIICAVVLVLLVLALAAAHRLTADPNRAQPSSPATAGPLADPVDGTTELVTRPMLELPAHAAQTQPMTTATAGPALRLPVATLTSGRWIPGGFPATPEGALAQLVAGTGLATAGADPETYARAYRELSKPGAPDPAGTGLSRFATSMRAKAGLPLAGVVDGLSSTFDITHGQIKGTAADGAVVVACVLGQYSVTYQGHTASLGIGDCQALHWDGMSWRIAAGALAAAAPCAWPGSADAVKAGYRELS